MSIPAAIDDIDAYLQQHEQKELLRFVTVGSVDDGKSTLIGRLLHDTHGIYEDQLLDAKRATEKRGGAGEEVDLALVTDGLRAEREQGITIDVAYRYFSTATRKFIIADTPGHVQYTRNMATGASTADVALILIDARLGVLQQSRRHAYIASLLGIPNLAVCVNKMDLEKFSQQVFDTIKQDFEHFSQSLRFSDVRFFPVSAVAGDNVVSRSDRTPWYRGPTLLDFLETIPIGGQVADEDLRFPVQYVLRPNLDYRGFCGQIASGIVRKGDSVLVLPSGHSTRITSIDTYAGELEEAFAPMSVTLRLEDEIDVSRGDMLVHTDREPRVSKRIEAQLVWMSTQPLDGERSYFLKHTTRTVRAAVEHIMGRLDLDTLAEVPSKTLELNDIGRVRLACNLPLHADAYRDNRATGAFVLIDALSNDTVAAGMLERVLDDDEGKRIDADASLVADLERQERLGQTGIAIWFAGAPTPQQRAIAYAVERLLFDRGQLATVVDVEAVADTSRSMSLLADIATQCVRAGLITLLSSAPPRDGDTQELNARLGKDRRFVISTDAIQNGDCVIAMNDVPGAAQDVVAALEARGVLRGSNAP